MVRGRVGEKPSERLQEHLDAVPGLEAPNEAEDELAGSPLWAFRSDGRMEALGVNTVGDDERAIRVRPSPDGVGLHLLGHGEQEIRAREDLRLDGLCVCREGQLSIPLLLFPEGSVHLDETRDPQLL